MGGVEGVVHEKPVALTIGNIGVFSGCPEGYFREKKLRKFRDLWLAEEQGFEPAQVIFFMLLARPSKAT